MSAMPANTDALTLGPGRNVIADSIDAPGNFMTRDTRVLKPWQ
jgi:hypothetical protein